MDKQFELAGRRFSTSYYKSRFGHRLLKNLVQISKKTIGVLAESIGKSENKDLDLEVDKFILSNAASLVFSIADAMQDLPDDQYTDLMMQILSTTFVFESNGPVVLTPEKFDEIFKGKYLESFELIKEVLRFQYNDFLSRLGTVLDSTDSQVTKPKRPATIHVK